MGSTRSGMWTMSGPKTKKEKRTTNQREEGNWLAVAAAAAAAVSGRHRQNAETLS
jgi:hypothetical protein